MNPLLEKIKLFEQISYNSYQKIKKIAETFSIEQLKDLNPSYAKNEAQNIINFVTSSYAQMPEFVKNNNLQPLLQKLQYTENYLNYEDDYNKMIPPIKQASDIIHSIANYHEQSQSWALELHQKAKLLARIPEALKDRLPKGATEEDYMQEEKRKNQPISNDPISDIENAISNIETSI